MNRTQLTDFRHLGYRKAIKTFREGGEVYRLRVSGENKLVEDVNELTRLRLKGIYKDEN